MQSSNCLNCDTSVQSKFCPDCGQKADTHRITAKHFILHDVVHGVWHVDKGILYTLKQVILRPGYAAREYIAGKRVRYYNIFYLILIMLGIMVIAGQHVDGNAWGVTGNGKNEFSYALKVIGDYYKVGALCFIPIFAFTTYILFPKLQYNFFEHMIASGFVLTGIFLIMLVAMILDTVPNSTIDLVSEIFGVICILYPIWAYNQFTKTKYKFSGFFFRILLFYIFIFLEINLLLFVFAKTLSFINKH